MDFAAIKAAIPIDLAIPFLGLTLKRTTNGQLRGKCPACDSDNDRALVVTPGRGAYCFNEKRGGDVLWLVSHVKGVGVRQAAQELVAHFQLSTDVKRIDKPQEPQSSKPSGTGAAAEGVTTLAPLAYLQAEHEAVQALLDVKTAELIGCGYSPKGLMRGRIAWPLRTETGKLIGYLGTLPDADVKLPTKFHL